MVKITINLDDDIYSEIVKESIEKYGSTSNISKIINQRLSKKKAETRKKGNRIVFKVKSDIALLDADKEIRKDWEGSGK